MQHILILPLDDQTLDKMTSKSADMLYAQVVERIRQWIMGGYLKEGDILPSERELAQILGVSRMPIREGLKILEFLGVVQYIRGTGVLVKNISIHHVLNNIDFMILDRSNEIRDIVEMRQTIEVQAAYFAAQRRTQEDLNIMEDTLFEMQQNIVRNKDLSDISMQFHSAIIDAAYNKVMIRVNAFLSDLFRYSRQETLKDLHRKIISLESHKQIFSEIKRQNARGAAFAMQKHLQAVSGITGMEQNKDKI